MIFEKLSNIERHMQLYGPLKGLDVYFRPRLARGEVVEIHPFEPSKPVFLRTGTSDLTVFRQVFIDREYGLRGFPQWDSVARRAAEIRAAAKRPVILDGGANIGLASIYFAREIPEALIIAVEPEASNFALLEKNTSAYANIVPLRAALMDRPGTVNIANPDAEAWAFRVEEAGSVTAAASQQVEARTVQSICSAVPDGELLIAKIDIEGAGQALFRSSTDWVRGVGVLIVELHDWMLPWEGSSLPFLSIVSSGEYDVVNRGENTVAFNRRVLRRAECAI
ncbi:MAG: FkbM family methyltransferase [Burkholderiales bacterium]|nr:FkbM family methyltransferase [Burkholderiales bacterium]